MIDELKAINMTDGVKKIQELVRIKNKTQLALRKMKEKEKYLELMKQRQHVYQILFRSAKTDKNS
jgi:hypothetical protein